VLVEIESKTPAAAGRLRGLKQLARAQQLLLGAAPVAHLDLSATLPSRSCVVEAVSAARAAAPSRPAR